MTELKTLKDLEDKDIASFEPAVKISKVREETIKWVKEDIEFIDKFSPSGFNAGLTILQRWRERFNITEEDLK